MSDTSEAESRYSFVQKVWIVGGIFSLIATLLLIFEATFTILILVLAGALIACFFSGLSLLIKSKTGWNTKISMAVSVVGTLLIVGGISWLIGATVSSQATEIEETLPQMVKDAQQSLSNSRIGREVLEEIQELQSSEGVPDFVRRFFMTTFGGIGDIYIILLIGIFFTISPQLYKEGIIKLVPPRKRGKAKKVLRHVGTGLTKWLAGKFIAMLGVFVLTAIGLLILDFPMWLTLALIAGILNFVPNFGPLAAMIPAVLIGFAISPSTALIVALLYTGIQLLESSLITPKAQQKMIKVPPALIILSQLFVGSMTGIWGVVFATPLVLIIIILVQDLYVKPMEKNKIKHKP